MNKNILLLFALLLMASQAQYTYYQNAGCAAFDATGKCTGCKDRYYMYVPLSLCLPVSPLCKDYSTATGACTSCVDGFALSLGQCQPSFTMVPVSKNQLNCAAFNTVSQLCEKCNDGFTLLSGACIQTIANCNLYSLDGKCSQCVTGYILSGSACAKIVPVVPLVPIDVNCKLSDSVKCLACKDGYLLTSQAACVKISPLCAKYNLDGICVECEPSFTLDSGKCYSKDLPSLRTVVYDPLCNRFDKGVCVKCSWGAFFDTNGKCKVGNPLCREMDSTGACLSCYSGFTLKDGGCVTVVLDLDPNCNLFDGAKCIKCSMGAYFDANGKCVISDPNCRKSTNGVCESCYPGFIMNDKGACIIDTQFNCADWSNGQCNRCSKGYYLDAGKCKLINTLCAKFDFALKKCTACYNGYALYQGDCTDYSKLTGLSGYDINCKQYDDAGKCLQCFDRYFLQYGTCAEVSPYCKTYNAIKGYCLSCYDGYRLDEQGACILN